MLDNLQDRVEQWGEAMDLDDSIFAAEAGVVTIALGDGKGTAMSTSKARTDKSGFFGRSPGAAQVRLPARHENLGL